VDVIAFETRSTALLTDKNASNAASRRVTAKGEGEKRNKLGKEEKGGKRKKRKDEQ